MKFIRTLFVVAAIAAIPFAAYAAETVSTDTSFTVTGTAPSYSIVRLSVFDEKGNICWIDSQTAGEDDSYSFSFSFEPPAERTEYDLYINGISQKLVLLGNADAAKEISDTADQTALAEKLAEYAVRFGYDIADWEAVSDAQKDTAEKIFRAQLNADGVKKAYMAAVGIAKFNDAVSAKDRSAAEDALVKFGNDIGVPITEDKAGTLTGTQLENLIVKLMAKTYQSKSEFCTAYTDARKAVTSSGSGSGSGSSSGGSSGGSSSGGNKSGGVGIVGAPIEKPEPFDDLDGAAWAKDSILALYSKGIVSGKGYKTFAPGDDVTREEFVAMLVRMLELKSDKSAGFEDVLEDAWFKQSVDAAFENGIISGISDTLFGAGRPVTREDCAVICKNVLTLRGADTVAAEQTLFDDNSDIADYAKAAVYDMRAAGVISGTGNNRFEPKTVCSRAMAAKIIDVLGGMIR